MSATTRGIIYSVKLTQERSGEPWCKVSWCYMTRGSGKGARWKTKQVPAGPTKRKRSPDGAKKKKKVKMRYVEVVDVNDVPICTWVKKKQLPLMVVEALCCFRPSLVIGQTM